MDSGPIVCEELPADRACLRVAVVTETYPPEINGVALTIQRVVEALQKRGHQVQLIRPRQNSNDRPSQQPNLEEVLHHGIPIPRYDSLRLGLPAKQALLRAWSFRRPDVVHVVTEGPLAWSAVAAAVKLKIPCVTDFHTNFHSYSTHYRIGWLKKPILAYLRKLHNKAQRTFVPTAEMRDALAAHGYDNLQIVGRGVDTELFDPARRDPALRETWNVRPDQPVALYVGRIAAEKNLPLLVDAYAAMKRARPDVKLVLVGDGPERAALRASRPDIFFAGARTGRELAAHYASGDLFLFPSTTETYGNVTVEAMASGLAIVAYDYAAAREHIVSGHNGLLAPFNDPQAFIRLAVDLAQDTQRIAALRQQARITALGMDWERSHDAFEAALIEVVESHVYATDPEFDDAYQIKGRPARQAAQIRK